MLILLFLFLTGFYLAGVGFLFYHWQKISPVQREETEIPPGLQLSVVVVVRNEGENILNLLNDLADQSLDKNSFEVLVVNDHSTDDTCACIENAAPVLPFALRLLHLPGTGKKSGLEYGIRKASGKIIVVTDGDCRPGKDWLLSVFRVFLLHKPAFLSGPVTFYGEKSLFEKIQTIEFASLVGSGAAMLQAGIPGMCNAANMAFPKEVFEQVEGYEANRCIPSGDDEFLLKAVSERFPDQVLYLKSPNAVVQTQAQGSWQAFFHQRKRWAGKWRLHKSLGVAAIAVLVFFFHVSWIILSSAILLNYLFLTAFPVVQPLIYFFTAALLKFAAEFLFLQIVLRSMSKKLLLIPFLVLQFLYPFYVLFFGLAVNFGSFNWKGRTYKYTNT